MPASHASLAYLALGSNLGDRVAHLVAAREAIGSMPDCTLLRASSLYETAAWGAVELQPDYLNAVVAVETMMSPEALWSHLARIELAHGRVRGPDQNSARTLDIDMLLFDDMVLNTTSLVLPHPRMQLRKFVLVPLLEIAPAVSIPAVGLAADALTRLVDVTPRKLPNSPTWK